ncbi:hypothetical protein Q0F99_00895 [Rathayibacter oskolensis]|uniref:hypothetical protein n=1 Tax=Rathayibacter oskolensis TaxID=1891671 RepID=UPI00265D6B8B|nr:hypothetical protein [Rathayibacter oskolensis]WKK71787.1 hypothetical protein Q0F99_00895 [Rathayibacter oskolensis]
MREEPDTFVTSSSSSDLPTTSPAMPLAKRSWYCLPVAFSDSGVTVTAVTTPPSRVIETPTDSLPPGEV